MVAGVFEGDCHRFNSGVMVLRGQMLREDLRDDLLDFSRDKAFNNEQRYVNAFCEERGVAVEKASVLWNFQELFLRFFDDDEIRRFMNDIAILHYAGPPKPWLKDPSEDMRPSMRIWHDVRESLKAHKSIAS